MHRKIPRRAAVAAVMLLVTGTALAHPGHGETFSFAEGLAHPFGIDHLLAMLAVGLWSAAVLPPARRWLGPAVFLAAMGVGAALAMAGLSPKLVEFGVAASLLGFGSMLLLGRSMPIGVGLSLTAAGAALHGMAHGMELPVAASAASYALGFLSTTALLHGGGVAIGAALRQRTQSLTQAAGMGLGVVGLALLAARI